MTVWQGLFAFCAVYNLAIGVAMAATPDLIAGQVGVAGPGSAYAIAMVGMLIAVFGIGYAIVSRDPARNRGIVWVGLLSKLGATAIGTLQYAAGALPASTFAMSMGDLGFAALFLLFLWRGPQAA